MPGIRFNSHTQARNDGQEARLWSGLLASSTLFKQFIQTGLDLIFPPRCAGCGKVDTWWCEQCQFELDTIPPEPLLRDLNGLKQVAATGIHQGKLQDTIWKLKYDNARHLAAPLGVRLAACLQQLEWAVDMIAPVPLHPTRLKVRGYNQSQLLGETLSQHTNLPCVPVALERRRNTLSQVRLSPIERAQNVFGAFQAYPEFVQSRSVLLVDDVLTTGATLRACADALQQAGARRVYGLTITVASG